MKILVTGASGQLGGELCRQAGQLTTELIPCYDGGVDITQPEQIFLELEKTSPDLVINAAAYTNVEGAETDVQTAFAVNRDGAALLAEVCRKRRIPLIHVSTDFVFDGKKGDLYHEEDPVSPLNTYGLSKEAGESAVRKILPEHLIIRTAWLYSPIGSNFVKTMLRMGAEQKKIRVVADQYGSPTAASDFAAAILTIADKYADGQKIQWGTYHYCGRGVTSWHGFAEAIFRIGRSHCPMAVEKVEPISSKNFTAKAKRPAFSALDCSRIKKVFGIQTVPWEESLQQTIRRIIDRC